MSSRTEAEAILGECGTASTAGVYVVGSLSRGVSFLTQQLRSLNVVWALFETRKVRPDDVVGVVGGGLAGLTAAAALTSKGARVILYESGNTLMRLQANSKLRYVHPHAHLWPDTMAIRTATDLPFLNWQADTAHNVRLRILRQWTKHFEPQVSVRKDHEVSMISVERSRPVVTVSRPRFGRDNVDCVVTTVGFGVERPWHSRPYWEPDGLEYQVTTAEPRIWVVAGTGDGGLIDVLRLRFEDFEYATALSALCAPGLEQLRNGVKEAERAAATFLHSDDRGGYLFSQYKLLAEQISSDVSSTLLARLRNDTQVHMVSPHPTPFSTSSMPINRILISLLLSKDTAHGLQYHPGRCREDDVESVRGRYKVQLSGSPTRISPITCDQVLFRHGPEPVLDRILNDQTYVHLKERHHAITGPTAMALREYWPVDFYTTAPDVDHTELALPEVRLAGATDQSVDAPVVLYCGAMIKGTESGAGTLGCFVALRGGDVGFLSTTHVLARAGQGVVGDPVYLMPNSGKPIGRLHSYINMRTGRGHENSVDAAVAVLDVRTKYHYGFAPHHTVPLRKSIRSALPGERVFKVGATSGLTYGRVVSVAYDVVIRHANGQSVFVDTIRIEPEGAGSSFAEPGDSGAIVVAADGAPIGLLFAFAENRAYAVACPMDAVCAALNCEVLAPTPGMVNRDDISR